MSNNELPDADVIEVSIFGPGKGESVLVHLGHGKWIMVDSCIDAQDGSITAINYLERIGVSIDSDVIMILGTHAHDDHIAGISRALDSCKAAFFACSSALTGEDFISILAEDFQAELGLRKSAYSEYRKILNIVDARRIAAGGRRFLKRAVENLPLIDETWRDGSRIKVTALSPSHEAVTRALKILASASIVVEGKPRRPFRGDPNEFSVALWIECFDKTMLLGADLLKGPSGCGWAGILSEFTPANAASLFKVPHHGSPNADHPDVWNRLLEDNPVALLAPFSGGRRPLPDKADVDRIIKRTANAFITASPVLTPPRDTTRHYKANLGNLAINPREQLGKMGQVRARSKVGQRDWEIQLFGPAEMLQRVKTRRKRR
jgi:hypothetical protein